MGSGEEGEEAPGNEGNQGADDLVPPGEISGVNSSGTAAPVQDSAGLPPPPGVAGPTMTHPEPRRDRLPKLLLGVVGTLLVAVLTTFVILVLRDLGDSERELEALGAVVEEPSVALTEAEDRLDRFLGQAEAAGLEAGSDGEVSCWFSYPEGEADPSDYLRCGPVAFADSEPGTYWLTYPVSFRSDGDATRVDVGSDVSPRTSELSPDEELVRPDDAAPPEEIDLERPPAQVAEPGAVGSPGRLMVDLEDTPEDGRLVGLGHETVVVAHTTTDRVMIEDEDLGRPGVYEAAEGERWLIAQITSTQELLAEDIEYSIGVGDQTLPLDTLTDDPLAGIERETTFVASVPTDAEDVKLVVAEEAVSQSWSFTNQQRSEDAPGVLYREDRVAEVNGSETLPYAVVDPMPIPPSPAVDLGEYGSYPEIPGLDLSIPFGDVELTMEVGEARLHYGLERWSDSGTKPVTASGPDRALLYLTGTSAASDNPNFWAQELSGSRAVLTLDDGTEIEAIDAGGGPFEYVALQPLGDDWEQLPDVLGAPRYWEVPADIESATLTITPVHGGDDTLVDLDFQDGSFSFDIEFD